jgi:scyllo-inositol 2-dehydrogenase (NADP+)
MKLRFFTALLLVTGPGLSWSETSRPPVPFAIMGLAHDHANGFIPRVRNRTELQLAGIVESNPDLVMRYARAFSLPTNLFSPTLEALLARTNVQAVATFTSTFQHRQVVEQCAPRGIHVMVEKPLAVNLADAHAMSAAAKKGGIHVIVNYETTWYRGNQNAYTIVHDQHAIGDLRRIVVHDGHRGPKEIGCSSAFLEWLTDPVLNGGGALTDFGCYGADLITWLMDGQRPTAVLAVTQQIKPEVYPKVDDDATILLTYPHSQGIIQASWNWPFDRKDLEIYGRTGYVLVPQRDVLRIRKAGTEESELKLLPPPMTSPLTDEIAYLAAVVRGEVQPSGLSSLEVNLVVTEILDAARQSAQSGKRVDLPAEPAS